MSVHNGEAFLREAVDSVLAQTMPDFEFIVFDDGSTDGSGRILAGYTDPRLRVIRNERSIGLTASLIRGVELARGRYVARLDADDVAEKHRLARQVGFLGRHPDVGIVGSEVVVIDPRGRRIGRGWVPHGDAQIRWTALFQNPIVHPSALLRRELLVRHGLNYDPAFRTSQDYDLWVRLLEFCRAENFAEPLIRYRVHRGAVSLTRRDDQAACRTVVGLQAYRQWLRGSPRMPGTRVAPELLAELQRLYDGRTDCVDPAWEVRRPELAMTYLDWLETLLRNCRTGRRTRAGVRGIGGAILVTVAIPPRPAGPRGGSSAR